MDRTKVSVSERAIVARINRKLAKEMQSLRRCREDSRGFNDLGSFYILDLHRNSVEAMHVDVKKLARELDVIADFETIEMDD